MSSIEKRSDDRYRVKFRIDGAQRSLTFDSEKGAKEWKKKLDALGALAAMAMLDRREVNPLTVGGYLERHISSRTGTTRGTLHTYRALVRNHMAQIAEIPLALLDREAVAAWVNSLAKAKNSGKTIANIHGLLSSALSIAVSDKLILDNPCYRMRLPRTDHNSAEMIFLTRDEFDDLYALIPAHYQPFVLTLVCTGMRFGEATALTVGDVNLETKSIRIRQSWKKTGFSQRELGPTKTKRSNRTVAIPPQIAQELVPLIQGRSSKAFLFLNLKGRPISGAFGEKTWTPAVQKYAGDTVEFTKDKAGRKVRVVTKIGDRDHPRLHDLRHTFASWAIQDNIPLTVIQRQLGHESIKTTSDRYGHIQRSDYDILANAISLRLPSSIRAIEG